MTIQRWMFAIALLSLPLALSSLYHPALGAFLVIVYGLALLRKSTRGNRYWFIGRLLRPSFPRRSFLGSLPIVTLILIVSLLPLIPVLPLFFAYTGRFWMFDQKYLFVMLFSILVGLFTVRLMVRLLW